MYHIHLNLYIALRLWRCYKYWDNRRSGWTDINNRRRKRRKSNVRTNYGRECQKIMDLGEEHIILDTREQDEFIKTANKIKEKILELQK